ncbi:MAG: methionyl-tRNA formyltransferase, partial [Alphaproteobacteria bacterium]|nr:methionyl-tRNA formyltransferase [Alphaproteobacteria bacterium]
MNLIFMGTPDFAVPSLAALADAGHTILRVYTQPPRPAGRGQRERLSPVHAWAESRGIPVSTPRSLRDPAEQERFAALGADLAVVAAYGLILPQAILDAPRRGCLNVHGSLLPRWRGAAPIHRAILAGDAWTGITIMRMEAGLDTGPMLLDARVAIGPTTTTESLHDELAALGARLIVEAVARLDEITARPQPEDGVTYAAKLTKDEGRLDWTRPAAELERRVRALPCWFEHGGERIRVLAAELAEAGGPPGTVLDDRPTIACGEGALRPLRL